MPGIRSQRHRAEFRALERPPRRQYGPFDVKLSEDDESALALRLATAIEDAKMARTSSEAEIQYWHQLYEQGRTRIGRNEPWPDAADLTSHIGTEKVDAYRARIMKTIMVEPVWTVEGWGEAAARAPYVEEFHQWQVEQEGLQSPLARAIHLSLVETRGVLEIYEESLERPVLRQMNVALQLAEDGSPILDEDNKPLMQVGPDQKFVEAQDGQMAQAVTVVDGSERVRVGPQYRVLPYRDFLILPGHAAQRAEVWGYAKQFYRTLADLRERAKGPKALYHADRLEAIGTEDERASDTTLSGRTSEIAPKYDEAVEKELHEIQFLDDLDGKGRRWYLATLHVAKRVILRLRHDDLGMPRYILLIPFPRPDRYGEGYSLIGHKLITTIEEHTAWRNMAADRASMVVQAPIKRLIGAAWDPEEQPWGPKAIIDVRDHREVEPVMNLPDVTPSVFQMIDRCETVGERLSGINDTAAGQEVSRQTTLGEVQIMTEQSFVRMEEIIKNIQEGIEDLGQIRHVIWQRTLAEDEQGLEVPSRILTGLESRFGSTVEDMLPNKRATAALLQGAFKFKPRGSVETADLTRQSAYFNQFLAILPRLMMVWPSLQMLLGPNIQAARAMMEQALRLYRIPDRQSFLGPAAMQAWQQAMTMQQQMMQMGGPGPWMGAPAPPGGPQSPQMGPSPGAGPMGAPGPIGGGV